MTDRIKGFVVTLEEDKREDDVAHLQSLIAALKGVHSVSVSVHNVDDHINRQRIRQELIDKLWGVLNAP